MSEAGELTLNQAHETFAKSFISRCWALLSKAERTADGGEGWV